MSSHKLTFDEFDKPNKNDLYKNYADLYDQKEDYRKIIINQTGGRKSGNSGQIQESSKQNFSTMTPIIREFESLKTRESAKNLTVGSSITARSKPNINYAQLQVNPFIEGQ